MDQFAGDGGNREQALNYQLFAWEFSWQAAAALEAAGRQVSAAVQERLLEALRFFATVQMPEDPWDYGDSDNAVVTPFALDERRAMNEWYQWATAQSPALQFWWPRRPKMPLPTESSLTDRYFSESGMVIRRTPSQWTLRWDVSPLGYLAPAAHGHLDALHLSLWYRGIAMVVDPGTGAYYADADLRQYLASREAHNGPAPCDFDFPKRVGPFLWARHHEKPSFCRGPSGTMAAEAQLPVGTLRRVIAPWRDGDGWQVEDRYSTPRGGGDFGVHWQFPPDSVLEKTGEREFRLRRRSISLRILIGNEGIISAALEPSGQELWLGTVSPAFRIASWGPYLHLTGHGGEKPCVLRTTFLASRSS
jgi:hypothetical protein